MEKKRANYTGTVRKLPSGTWRGQVMDGYTPDGKKNVLNFTAPTKGEVQTLIRNYWLERGDFPSVFKTAKASKTPFDTWADTWYADYQTQVQPSTYCNYQYTLKVLKNYFQGCAIENIKPIDVNQFSNHMVSSSMSRSYITKCRSMLIQILDSAEANGIIPSNPARKAKTVRIQPSLDDDDESKKDAFSDEEQELLNTYLPDNVIGHTIRLMLGTGMRTQEILALKKSDFTEGCAAVRICKAIKTVNGLPTLGPPKSKKGKRIIPIPLDYRADASYLCEHSGTPYIWTSKRENGLFDIGSFRRRYYATIKKIPGVRKLSPHCLRHTYITNLEKKGVPIEQIARLAGHSRISTTDGYVHIDLTSLSDTVSVLNKNSGS